MSDRPSPHQWAFKLSHVLNTVLGHDHFPINVGDIAKEYSAQICPAAPITLVSGKSLPGFEGGLFKAPPGKKEGVVEKPVNPFLKKITRLHNTSFRSIVNFVMKISRYPMQHVNFQEIPAMAISPDEHAFFVELGARVAELRKAQGITQIQMAEALGVSQQTINSYEVARRRIPASALPMLARLLATSVDSLLDEPTKKNNKRGPAPKLLQQMERVSLLPRAKQKFVIEMIDTVIQQAS